MDAFKRTQLPANELEFSQEFTKLISIFLTRKHGEEGVSPERVKHEGGSIMLCQVCYRIYSIACWQEFRKVL